MKNFPYPLLLCLSICLLALCSACDDEGNLDCPNITVGPHNGEIGDSYDLLNPTIVENCLSLIVSYSGGCMEHDFELRWDGSVAESFPPQTWLTLHHTDPDDPCDAVPSEQLLFDLSVMEQNAGEGPLLIWVTGLEEALLYEY